MNSAERWGNRGEHIKPSARKSIHNHYSCPFASGAIVMEQYVVDKRNTLGSQPCSPSTLDSGRDEVDNIISKHASPTSALPIIQENNQRRNSFSSEHHRDVDENSKMLSKSLPEKFVPYLYSSDKSHMEEDDLQTSNCSLYESVDSNQLYIPRLNNISLHKSHDYVRDPSEEPPISELQKHLNLNIHSQTKETSFNIWHVLMVVLCGLLIYSYSGLLTIMQEKTTITSGNSYDNNKFYDDMSSVGKMYNLNQDAILQLQVGISSISENEDTDSFIFVYNSEKHSFNSTAFNEFINKIASMSARLLRNETELAHFIVIDTSSINAKNSEELIHEYRDDIKRGGVMVMRAIDMLPSSLAMALHYYCDVYNPLVKKSAMFFTLDITNCSDKTSTHSHIENCLKRKWSGVSSEFIAPLLARVVSVVVDVTTLF